MPAQQKKSKPVVDELFKIANSKIEQIKILNYQLENAKTEEEKRLLKALIHANKVMTEDIVREAGYMLPQSKNTNKLLHNLLKQDKGENKEVIEELLNKIKVNE